MILKAIIWTRYGPAEGLQLQEVEQPVPKENEILIKIHATTVTAGDCEMRILKFPFMLGFFIRLFNGIRRPKRIKILGQELAGEVVEVGNEVTKFNVGDKVFGSTDFFMGAYAQYKCLPEKGVAAIKPTNMSYEEAASIPLGGTNALHFLKEGNLQSGQHLLINGAGGSIGTIAIQLAKHYGAKVTAVDSTNKLEVLTSLGADHVIDYTQEDFTESGNTYDVIFDVVGKASISGSMKSLREDGVYLLGNTSFTKAIRGRWNSFRTGRKLVTKTADPKADDLILLRELIEAGTLTTVIDRTYPLEQMVDAHKYVEQGGKKGNVVVTVSHA
jgi:2-desacetyl-2-hydroxyethyl bacteriochlorophyllide A dehydrogenase